MGHLDECQNSRDDSRKEKQELAAKFLEKEPPKDDEESEMRVAQRNQKE